MRLLPWTGEGGQPAYLSTGDGDGYVARLADDLEAEQVGMAGDLMKRVRRITAEEKPSEVELRSVVDCLLEALGDVVRVAQSSGDRLPVQHDDGLSAVDGGSAMTPGPSLGTSTVPAGEGPCSVMELWPSVPHSVGRARGFVAAHLDVWGLSQLADSALLVVSELVTNAVVHAHGLGGVCRRRHAGGVPVTAVLPPVAPAAAARRWAVTTGSGEAFTGYLPGWADEDPSATGVPAECLPVVLADITHHADMGGLVVPVSRAQERAQDAPVLAVHMECRPFLEDNDGDVCIPVVSVQVTDDFWIRDLDPAAVIGLGQRLRALGDRLVTPVAPALAAARTDWTRQQPPGRSYRTVPGRPVRPDVSALVSRAAPGTARGVTADGRTRRRRPSGLGHEPAAVAWARERAGLTKRELARRIGISEVLMGEIESGWRNATPAKLTKIAEVLNCPRVALERKREYAGEALSATVSGGAGRPMAGETA